MDQRPGKTDQSLGFEVDSNVQLVVPETTIENPNPDHPGNTHPKHHAEHHLGHDAAHRPPPAPQPGTNCSDRRWDFHTDDTGNRNIRLPDHEINKPRQKMWSVTNRDYVAMSTTEPQAYKRSYLTKHTRASGSAAYRVSGMDRHARSTGLKRPHLLPVYDNVIRCAFGTPDQFWSVLRTVLRRPDVGRAIAELRRQLVPLADISDIRLIDVALWMRHHREHLDYGCPGIRLELPPH